MAAPKGNQFWRQRSKHGRDAIFSTPAAMLEAAYEYFEWAEKNSLKEEIIQGGKRFQVGKMRAFTLAGMCIFMHVHSTYFNEFKEKLTPDTDPIHKDYSQVIKIIEDIIREQKFTGAAAGLLNPNIIARDLGLSDKVDSNNRNTNTNDTTLTVMTNEDRERIKAINQALEDKI